MSGMETVLTRATTTSRSLRTTVPEHLIKKFELESGDKLSWDLDIKDGELVILVSPVKK